METYKIYAAMSDDISEGFVWLKKAGLPPRCVVKITNTGKTVFCEALQLEANFLRHYNQTPRFSIHSPDSAVVMSFWFRNRLGGLETQKEYPLDIVAADSPWGKFRACFGHPQIVVRVAVWLGVISVALGLLGVVLGILSVWPGGCT